jgi:serine/threonine protein kinase
LVETGRLIQERYRLQQLIKQGQAAEVYFGWDEVLSRAVAVKIVPAPHIAAYRAAIKLTSHFSHPNIVSMYDLVIEPERLYVVQEYIEGDDFAALMQKPLTPLAVVDLGCQICQALIYTGSPSRRVSHGDLTPSAVMRDRNGFVRVNNFALPADTAYFQRWKEMGGERGDGPLFSEMELPWGTWSEERQADDTRAVGLLLYQLLASRIPGTHVVEPRPDGRLSFQRNVPPEVCEAIARAVARQHPDSIRTPEALFLELKRLSDALETAVPAMPVVTEQYEPAVAYQYSPAGGQLATVLPAGNAERPVASQGARLPLSTAAPSGPSAPTVAEQPLKLAAARQAAYPERSITGQKRSPVLLILLICLIVFALLFVVGYAAGQALIPH